MEGMKRLLLGAGVVALTTGATIGYTLSNGAPRLGIANPAYATNVICTYELPLRCNNQYWSLDTKVFTPSVEETLYTLSWSDTSSFTIQNSNNKYLTGGSKTDSLAWSDETCTWSIVSNEHGKVISYNGRFLGLNDAHTQLRFYDTTNIGTYPSATFYTPTLLEAWENRGCVAYLGNNGETVHNCLSNLSIAEYIADDPEPEESSSEDISSSESPEQTSESGEVTTVTDELTAAHFTATNTTYKDFSNVTFTSAAEYAGNSAKDSSGNIQLRSKNSNSGIVSTASGGKVKSVKITVASGSNTIDIYGNNTAYTAATDLYGNTKGTKVGSLTATGTITFTDDYEYVGIRSNNGAIYLSSIEITWE